MKSFAASIAILILSVFWSACGSRPVQPHPQEAAVPPPEQPPEKAAQPAPTLSEDVPPIVKQPWSGDLDDMAKRRVVRVLLPFRRPEFFYMEGRPVGILQEAFQELESVLNKKYKTTAANRIIVALLPTAMDQMETRMAGGFGDIAAASIAITEARKAQVDFTIPTATNLSVIPVTGPGAPELQSLDDLSGKEIWVSPVTRMKGDLEQLNAKLASSGKPPAVMRETDPVLEPGDILEMVNAGVYQITLMHSFQAQFWTRIFDNVKARPDLPLAEHIELGWAIHKNTPKLKAFLDDFIKTHALGTSFGNTLVQRYVKEAKYVQNATEANEMKKFRATLPHFKESSKQYKLDYLLLAAQGYQESRLDQNVKSPVGALGIMQVMPSTAASPPVNVKNIENEKNNIEAGARLIHFLIENHFNQPGLTIQNRMLFAMASYNAGPAKVEKCRALAKEMGYDPNVWFNNVEVAVAKVVGRETTQYVANIYKYYVAYKLSAETQQRRTEAKKAPKSI